jgi:uncharacterized protein (DUF1697 family)
MCYAVPQANTLRQVCCTGRLAKELRMPVYVSLFRGINVGGNNQVKMSELKALHEALGLTGVQPYIQSGNMVFTGDEADIQSLRERIEEGFARRFGFRSQVYLRATADMQEIIERNPFSRQPGKEPAKVVVIFLPAGTDPADWEGALRAYPGPEEVVLLGDELHLYYPNGQGASKIAATALGKQLKAVGTARNWNTVLKLYDLMRR